jgi:regulatory protein
MSGSSAGATSFLFRFLLCFLPVRSPARKVSTESDLYALSLRALTRRAYSIHEMRDYLGRRAENAELVSRVIARLREQKYLDDAKYALDYARQHAKARRQGRFRIARELRGRGVPDQHIEAALEAVFAETDESALVRARLKRQLSHIRGNIGERKIASIYRSLLRAGFSSDVIRAELRGVTRGDLPEFSDVTPEEA